MLKYLSFSILVVFSSTSLLISQNRAECILGDTLQLNLENARGMVFWEESEDSTTWTASSESSSTFVIQPSTQQKWIRAKIEEENCPTYYESPFRISAIDTSIANFIRSRLSVSDIDGQIISSQDGLLIIELNSTNLGFHAGDYIYGISGQDQLISIDAFILNLNVLYLYTSETSIPVYSIPLNFGALITTKVRGYVLNENGSGLFGAKVKIGNDSVYTDAKGVFQFNSVQVHEGYDFVKITKTTYFDGFKGFVPKDAGNELIISMLPETPVGFFSASAGAVVEFSNYQLEFPANGFTLNGNPFSGNVSVRMQELNPDSSSFQQSMPGALLGNYYGDLRSLLSVGMFSIELLTNNGQKLEIAEGQTVTISYTLNQEMAQLAPDSIDLWSFDESNGYWVCEGSATKIDNKYVAEFSHFSFWNYDFPFPPAYLHGLVFNSSGEPFSGATVQITTSLLQSGSDITNSSGAFGGLVPKNTELTVQAFYNTADGYQPISDVIVIPPILSDTFYIVINPAPELPDGINQVIGTAVDCDLLPLTDAYIIHDGNISYLNNGSFNFYTTSPLDSFKLVSANPTVIGQWHVITVNPGNNDVGSIQLCNGDTFLTGSLSDIDGNQYPSVLIGDVWWMASELKTTHFSDGSPIALLQDSLDWTQATASGYCFYDNNPANIEIYGNLYNGYSVMDSRNVCPVGWHIPTTTEYLQMEYLLGMLPSDLVPSVIGNLFRGAYANMGGKLKSTSHWQDPNTGATNEIGFSAVPLGFRHPITGSFQNLGLYGNYWLYNGIVGLYPIAGSYAPGYNESGMVYGGPAIISTNNGIGIRCVKID